METTIWSACPQPPKKRKNPKTFGSRAVFLCCVKPRSPYLQPAFITQYSMHDVAVNERRDLTEYALPPLPMRKLTHLFVVPRVVSERFLDTWAPQMVYVVSLD